MRRKVLFILVGVVLLGVAAWAIWGLGSSIQDHAEQDEIFQRLRQLSTTEEVTDLGSRSHEEPDNASSTPNADTKPDETDSSTAPKEPASVSNRIQVLQEENPECVAWISIEGTDLDYPVMWSPDDPDYYLDHSFEKTSNRHGVPFLDSRCNIEIADNLIIYGHHFTDGTMFSMLHKYASYSYYEDHPIITLETEAGISQYRIAAVLRVSGTVYPTVWSIFNSLYMDEQQFAEMTQEIKSRSLYSTGVSPVYGDRLLTLATCEYTQKNGRLAIVAVKET